MKPNKIWTGWVGSILLLGLSGWARELPPEIPVDTPWKKTIYEFAFEKLQHSAWGVEHFRRDFLLSNELAKKDGVILDQDVLFASAFLHDMGAFSEFKKEGVDHAVRAAELMDEYLPKFGFPNSKIPAVKETILSHMYDAPVSNRPEAIYFHDADTLDFLGTIGVIRIVSITSRHRWATNLKTAIITLKQFQKELPDKLLSFEGKKIGRIRALEMKKILSQFEREY